MSLELTSFHDSAIFANAITQFLLNIHHEKQRRIRGFYPTGRSVQGLNRLLRAQSQQWSQILGLLQIDEFIEPLSSLNPNGNSCGFFQKQLQSEVIGPLHLQSHFQPIQSTWSEAQMQSHITEVLAQPLDFAILGLGPNGHVGFHEPSLNQEIFFGGKVQLAADSFARVPGAPGPWAFTFGASSFLRAENILLLIVDNAQGEKQQIIRRFQESAPTAQIPATLLKKHPALQVFLLQQ